MQQDKTARTVALWIADRADRACRLDFPQPTSKITRPLHHTLKGFPHSARDRSEVAIRTLGLVDEGLSHRLPVLKYQASASSVARRVSPLFCVFSPASRLWLRLSNKRFRKQMVAPMVGRVTTT